MGEYGSCAYYFWNAAIALVVNGVWLYDELESVEIAFIVLALSCTAPTSWSAFIIFEDGN
jgi:hypothetical protein